MHAVEMIAFFHGVPFCQKTVRGIMDLMSDCQIQKRILNVGDQPGPGEIFKGGDCLIRNFQHLTQLLFRIKYIKQHKKQFFQQGKQ